MAFEELDRWAQLNVIVDKVAKQCLTRTLQTASRKGNTIRIPYVECIVSQLGNSGEFEPISSHLATTALNYLQKSDIKEYWRKKKNLSITMMNTIDWDILTKSAKKL